VVDASGCDPERLRDPAVISGLFDAMIFDLSLTLAVRPIWKVFPGEGGITGMALLEESHLTVHTFPEYGFAAINLYCCAAHPEWDWVNGLATWLGARDVQPRLLRRGRPKDLADLACDPMRRPETTCCPSTAYHVPFSA
jgi:S-adenosylmethionine decarboxylase